MKEHTINNLDYYLEQLVEKVQSHGGRVYWARTGDDVSRYIIELARARGVKSVVKSKSMATEEIELNLRSKPRTCGLETDLGEYISARPRKAFTHHRAVIHKTAARSPTSSKKSCVRSSQ